MWREREGVSLASVRPAKLCYVLAYAFELVFYAFHSTFLHTDSKLFGMGSSMLMYIGHILMSLVIMLLWSSKFKHLIYTSVAVTLLGFSAFLVLPDGIPKLLCAVLVMAGLGGCVTSARCGFAFAANNSERLMGVVLALAGRMLLNFTDAIFPDGFFWDNVLFTYVLPILLLAGLAFCLLRFRENDLEVKEKTTPEDSRGLYWAFALFTVFFALEGYTAFMETDGYAHVSLMSGIGKLIAIVLFIFILLFLKKSVWHIWNAFFGFAIITALLASFARVPALDAPVHILLGVWEIGWLAALYMLACAQRRFASLKLLKRCTLVFVILSPLTTLSDEVAQMFFGQHIAVIALIYFLLVAAAFSIVSPYTFKYLFNTKWMDDLRKKDMTLWYAKIEEADRFARYGLSPREKEILALLLTANTRRMIAGELRLSESTVKTHTSNLYKKLKISSRIELFRLFGVPEVPELPDTE
jgi:DNA-binding CsgD family transcriptional regulator